VLRKAARDVDDGCHTVAWGQLGGQSLAHRCSLPR
jgi:hypothetical protein